jgi:hypothetical protein
LAPAINFLARIIKQGSTATPHLSGMKRKTANIDIGVGLVKAPETPRLRRRPLE